MKFRAMAIASVVSATPFSLDQSRMLKAIASDSVYGKVINHGCWCIKLGLDDVQDYRGGGTNTVDALDQMCKDWIRARRCLTLSEGACESYEHENHAYPSYRMFKCWKLSDPCQKSMCRVDNFWANKINQHVVDEEDDGHGTPGITCPVGGIIDNSPKFCYGEAPELEIRSGTPADWKSVDDNEPTVVTENTDSKEETVEVIENSFLNLDFDEEPKTTARPKPTTTTSTTTTTTTTTTEEPESNTYIATEWMEVVDTAPDSPKPMKEVADVQSAPPQQDLDFQVDDQYEDYYDSYYEDGLNYDEEDYVFNSYNDDDDYGRSVGFLVEGEENSLNIPGMGDVSIAALGEIDFDSNNWLGELSALTDDTSPTTTTTTTTEPTTFKPDPRSIQNELAQNQPPVPSCTSGHSRWCCDPVNRDSGLICGFKMELQQPCSAEQKRYSDDARNIGTSFYSTENSVFQSTLQHLQSSSCQAFYRDNNADTECLQTDSIKYGPYQNRNTCFYRFLVHDWTCEPETNTLSFFYSIETDTVMSMLLVYSNTGKMAEKISPEYHNGGQTPKDKIWKLEPHLFYDLGDNDFENSMSGFYCPRTRPI